MATQDFTPNKCPKCDLQVPRSLRYCPSCYAPLQGRHTSSTHLDAVKGISTTKRTDPTVVFLPDVHEALQLRRKRRQRLLIIASVCVVLLSVLAFGLFQWNRRQQEYNRVMARQQAAVRELHMLATGLEGFRADMGRYPTEKEGLEGLINRTKIPNQGIITDEYQWRGPYVNGRYELDPWGNDYHYRVTSDGQTFELFSEGPEGLDQERLRVTSQPLLEP